MKSKPLILVVEDDSAIRRAIVDALAFASYQTDEATTIDQAMHACVEVPCDLILLDLVLPSRKGETGLDVLKHVRQSRPILPVIILTAMGGENDRVQGLKLGADDYVVKPFSVRELLARVEAVLRRSPERPLDIDELMFPGGKADMSRSELHFDNGDRIELSEREAELLRYLAINSGRAISRQELLSSVWGMDPKGINTRTIDMHVARLREKLRDDSHEPKVILTVRGKGYMFGQPEVAT